MGLLRSAPTRRLGHRVRLAASLLGAILALDATLAPSLALAQVTADAKTSLANGEKAARAKDWPKAVTEYEAANKAQPSADALEGFANAHAQQKHDAEAHAAYEQWLKTYGDKAAKPKKTAIEARLKEVGDRTGLLTLDVSEAGATILVDDRPMGTTPLAVPLRLNPGPHRLRVSKDGFFPSDQTPNTVAGATSALTVKLEAQGTKGRLNVREKTGKALRIIVDGVDMGDAPWSGEVEAGPHDVTGRGGALAAAPEKVTVERGKTLEVELTASASIATLKIGTSDGKGLIYIDNKLVGEGSFSGDIPAGAHALRITREGYDPVEEQIDLKDKETISRSITLTLSSKVETGPVQKENRALEGIYGGFGLLGNYLVGGMQSTMQKNCNDSPKPPELGSCDGQSGGLGGGLTGFLGYHWDPIGVELFLGAQYDQTKPTLNWNDSSPEPGIGPDPARKEEFSVRRVGGLGAIRIRLTLQGDKLRFSAAAGVGLSYRSLLLTRETAATANPAAKDTLVPDGESYLSPVISFEPSIQYRIGPHTAVSLGLSLLVESPRAFDQIPTTKQEPGHRLVDPSRPAESAGLTTPAYQLATGTQFFIGPVIGMMFGP